MKRVKIRPVGVEKKRDWREELVRVAAAMRLGDKDSPDREVICPTK